MGGTTFLLPLYAPGKSFWYSQKGNLQNLQNLLVTSCTVPTVPAEKPFVPRCLAVRPQERSRAPLLEQSVAYRPWLAWVLFHFAQDVRGYRLALDTPQLVARRDAGSIQIANGNLIPTESAQCVSDFRPVQIAPDADGDDAVQLHDADAGPVQNRRCPGPSRRVRLGINLGRFGGSGTYKTYRTGF